MLQIEALMAEKTQWTLAQQKVSSHLLHAERIQRGEPVADGAMLRQSLVEVEPGGMVTVDIRADVTPEVLARIDALGGSLVSSVPQYRAIRAQLPLAAVETLAELEAIQWIRPADETVMRSQQTGMVQTAVRADASDPAVTRKVNTSEGDIAHQADRARQQFNVDGTGIGIGVLSDGVDSLAARQASGDLPATVTILPGQARPPASVVEPGETFDEGTAMLEIVHDLAPGADLYFATASRVGQAQFAANIEALCEAGADVIVDDIGYLTEAVFQDDIVAQGINAAVANGCIYFSAAGNSGNLNDGTSGVWEGDFTRGAFLDGVGYTHYFRGMFDGNRITDDGPAFTLKWADPLGASSNDYDLLLLNSAGSQILATSLDIQNGAQDPIEFISSTNNDSGNLLAVIQVTGAADRYLHLNTHRGELGIATAGQTYDQGAFPISRSRAHTHRRHGHPLQTVPSAGLIERPQEKNRVDALR